MNYNLEKHEYEYIQQYVINVLESGNVIVLRNGLPGTLGHTESYDVLCIRTRDLFNTLKTYQKIGYMPFSHAGTHLICKATPNEIDEFSRTPEMREMFKDWHEAEHPPEMVRLFMIRKRSNLARVFVSNELKRELKSLRITPEFVTTLLPHEVFVFGTNKSGFHGAGAAGNAFRYNNSCNWRDDIFFTHAMKSPVGSPGRVGKWSVYGISEGPMTGNMGKSYGICTIAKPGQKKSVSLDYIKEQVERFTQYAKERPELNFMVAEIGTNLAGYTPAEVAPFFSDASDLENVYLPKRFHEIICQLI